MDPATIASLLGLAFNTAETAIKVYHDVKDSLAATDRADLDAKYESMMAADKAITDKLRATPDDPV